jgi:hypothetical protein
MTTYTLPASVFPWGPSGPEIPLPPNPDYDTGSNRHLTLPFLANLRTGTVTAGEATTITGISPPLTGDALKRANNGTATITRVDTNGDPVTPGFSEDCEIASATPTTITLAADNFALGSGTWTVQVTGSGTDVSYALLWLFTRTAFDGTTVTEQSGPYTAFSGTSEADRNTILFPEGATTWVEEGLKLGLGQNDGTKWDHDADHAFPIFRTHAWKHTIFHAEGTGHILWQEDPTDFDDGIVKLTVNTTANSLTSVLSSPLGVNRYNRMVAGIADGKLSTIQSDVVGYSQQNFTGSSTAGNVRLTFGTAVGLNVSQTATSVQSIGGDVFAGGQYGATILGYEDDRHTVVCSTPALVSYNTLTPPGTAHNTKFTFFNPAGQSYPGGAKGVGITAIAVDRQTFTTANPAYWTATGRAATLFLPEIKPERKNGVTQVDIDSPGHYLGVERAGIAKDLHFTGKWTIIGSNADDLSGITFGREQWTCFEPRRIDGLTVSSDVLIRHTWSDALYLRAAPQPGIDGADLQAENVTFNAKCNGIGRHWITAQGNVGLRADRAQGKNIERLGIDIETTDTTARCLDTEITDSVIAPGTALWHMAPAPVNGEPPRVVENVATIAGSQLITVPYDLVTSDDMGADFTHANIPADTYARRRMSPTIIELSRAATATGTANAVLGGATLLRDFVIRNVGMFSSSGNIPLDAVVPRGKAYFTGIVTAGSPIITDVQWESRIDGLTYTTADITNGSTLIWFGESNVFAGAKQVAVGHTSNTVTLAGNSSKTTPAADTTFPGSVIAGQRTLTTAPQDTMSTTGSKNHLLTGPGLRAGTVFLRSPTATGNTISLPASSTASGTYTKSRRMRFWINANDTQVWSDITVEELRPLKDGYWEGTGIVPSPLNQPWVMMASRVDRFTARHNAALGLRNGQGDVIHYMFGAYGYPPYGEPAGYDWTLEENYGYDFLDNQMATPTKTVALVMTVDSDVSGQPVFTIVGTRSDAASLDGYHIVITRERTGDVPPGPRDLGPAIFTGNTATFDSADWTDNPLDDGTFAIFQARWGNTYFGSWDSLPALSNEIIVHPGDPEPEPTATVLVVTPSSPQVEGVTLTLTATVTPDPSAISGTVTFRDGVTVLDTIPVVAGEAVRVLSTGRPAGVHPLTATFDGNVAFDPSTSNTVTFTTTAAPSTTPTTCVLAALPTSPQQVGQVIALNAIVTPTPNGGRVEYFLEGTLIGRPIYGTPVSLTLDTAGDVTFTADYLGNASFGASSDDLAFTVEPGPNPDPGPNVIDVDPEDGATDVPIDQVVTVTFDQPVDAVLRLELLDGTPVPGLYGYQGADTDEDAGDDDPAVWIFTPTLALDTNQSYRVRADATNIDGLALPSPFTSTFSTANTYQELIPVGLMVAR